MRMILAAAAGVFMVGCAAAPATQEAGLAGGEAKVCKRVTPTGSNLPQRICSTPAEWAELERVGREGVEEMKRHTDSLGTAAQGN